MRKLNTELASQKAKTQALTRGLRAVRHSNHAVRFLAPFFFVLLAAGSGSAQEQCSGEFAVTAPGSAATSTCPADAATLDSANRTASDNAFAQAGSVCRLAACDPPLSATTAAVQLLGCTDQVTTQITIMATCSTPTPTRGRFPALPAPQPPSRAPTPVVPQP
jgi:hypothetical protein